MKKATLSQQQVYELVSLNKYKPDPTTHFVSRCIDGRYEHEEKLPALAIAGADVGELAVLLATANTYGFEIDSKKAFDILSEVVGGVKKLQGHTDSHADPKVLLGGCGHIKHKTADPDAYGLTKENAQDILNLFKEAKEKGAKEVVLYGEHQEGAVLIVEGQWGVYPRYAIETTSGNQDIEAFVFHKTLVDERHRLLAKKLIEKKVVKLFDGLGEEYLYEAMSDVTEDHLMETATRLAKGLPIYTVNFAEDGTFKLEETGKV